MAIKANSIMGSRNK